MNEHSEQSENKRWYWATLLLGPLILVLLFSSIGMEQVISILKGSNPRLVLLAMLLAVPALLIRAWRWKLLISHSGAGLSYLQITSIFANSVFVGSVTPGRLGEFIRVFHLTKSGVGSGPALSSVLVDRLLDVAVLLITSTAGALLMVGLRDGLVGTGSIVVVVFAVWIARWTVCGSGGNWIDKLTDRILPSRLGHKMIKFRHDFCEAIEDLTWSQILRATALTLAAWSVNYLANYILARAMGLSLGFFDIAGISAITSLVALVPVSIAGAGTRDMAMILLLANYGIGKPQSLALSSLFLFFVLWCALLYGAWWTIYRMLARYSAESG